LLKIIYLDVGRHSAISDEETDDDVVEVALPNVHKGKRKAGDKVEWSDDEEEDAYSKFKNRASTKRKSGD